MISESLSQTSEVRAPAKPDTLRALEEAIAACDGNQSELARRIDKTQGHISIWLRRGRCAADSVLAIERETKVSRHRLRPDIFGPVPANDTPREAAE